MPHGMEQMLQAPFPESTNLCHNMAHVAFQDLEKAQNLRRGSGLLCPSGIKALAWTMWERWGCMLPHFISAVFLFIHIKLLCKYNRVFNPGKYYQF